MNKIIYNKTLQRKRIFRNVRNKKSIFRCVKENMDLMINNANVWDIFIVDFLASYESCMNKAYSKWNLIWAQSYKPWCNYYVIMLFYAI